MVFKPSKLIATLGSKPQLITLAVDCLKQSGENLDEIIVVHTRRDRTETQLALSQLTNDFSKTNPKIPLRLENINAREDIKTHGKMVRQVATGDTHDEDIICASLARNQWVLDNWENLFYGE